MDPRHALRFLGCPDSIRKYDTPPIYELHEINRYSNSVNWRAVIAFLVGVTPTIPGFINSINPSIDVGVHSYHFGRILGFVATSLALAYIWEPKESMIECAVLPDEVYDAMEDRDESGDTKESSEGDDGSAKQKKSKSWADGIL